MSIHEDLKPKPPRRFRVFFPDGAIMDVAADFVDILPSGALVFYDANRLITLAVASTQWGSVDVVGEGEP